MPDNELLIGARVDLGQLDGSLSTAKAAVSSTCEGMKTSFTGMQTTATEATKAIGTSATQATTQLEGMGTAGKEAGDAISNGMQKAAFSMKEAKGAMALMKDDLGINIPR